MARADEYDPSPTTAESYLSIPEADALLAAGPKALRDPRALTHFLTRVALTLRGYDAQMRQLHRDVQQARMVRERAGQATTMSPLDAVRFLTPDQLAPIMDAAVREKLTALERAKEEAARSHRSAHRELNRVKFAVTGLLEDADMSPRLREKLTRLMRAFEESEAKLPDASPTPTTIPAAPGPSEAAAGGLDGLFE